ncbi:MAG: hypothetical protein NT012_00385 [Candidatus Nealsonbacteria bacterium]|nr:hypothetical protein [Candidatus Nealsonbacteria bacterium]
MSIKSFWKNLPYLAIVPTNPNPSLIGIKYFNLDTFIGQTLGWLKWPTLIGMVFGAVAFIVATYFLVRYTRGFFAGRKIPKSWKLILWGVFITAIAEIGEMLGYYEWPNTGLIETNLLLLLPHALGGTLIGLGAYFLYKEIT